MGTRNLIVCLLAAAALLAWTASASDGLRPVSEFAAIAGEAERSAALFAEAGKVLQHRRCVNCHPSGDVPLQGEGGSLHEPPVRRGIGGLGVVGMQCWTCHQDANFDPGRVPGARHWALAPRKAGWEGLSLAEICEQVKDPRRNGARDLDELAEHMTEDALVAWGWEPGADREPAPGTQEAFGELVRAWIDTGAVCPPAD